MDNNDKTLAVLSHILGFLTQFVGPLIIYLVADNENSFAKSHAREALNFQITLAIGYFISFILIFFFVGILGLIVLWFLNLIFSILATVAAIDGKEYHYPVSIRFI